VTTLLMDAASSMLSQVVGEPVWFSGEEQVPGKKVFARQHGGGADHRAHGVLTPKQRKHD